MCIIRARTHTPDTLFVHVNSHAHAITTLSVNILAQYRLDWLQRRPALSQDCVHFSMSRPSAPNFDPGTTPGGELPPWEVAKAYAFAVVLDKMQEVTGTSVRGLVNATKADFIASQVRNANGEHPCARAVQHVVARCQDSNWYPGERACLQRRCSRS